MNRRTALASLTGAVIAGASSNPARSATAAITIDRTDGVGTGPRPGVVLLHGADGTTRRQQYQFAATLLAAQGFTVLFPHYFEITDDRRAAYGEIERKYSVWLAGLRQVLDDATAQPGIDARRIGLVGLSLGGALALSLAASDPRVGAAVSYCGFRPSDIAAGRHRAPTLVLHGDADRVVPVRNAELIETTLRERGVSVETHIYPGEGHVFSQSAQLNAAGRTAAFLKRHLGA